jgi:mycothiol synthase
MNDNILLPDAPQIEGLSFRRFAGESDYPAMVALLNKCSAADGLDHATTLEGLQHDYSHLVNCDPAQDMIMVEVNGTLIGYGRVYWQQQATGDWIYEHFGRIDPDWKRRGLGRAMLRHNQKRLREIAAGHPAAACKFFATGFTDVPGEEGNRILLEQEGYQPIRYFFKMARPNLDNIPDLPLPEGIEVRPARPEHYEAIVAANLEAFADHWGVSANPEDELNVEMLTGDPTFDPTIWQIAWDGDEVAGMILNYIDQHENETYGRRWGYTEEICVRRPWRKRGLAKALIARSLRVLKEQGMEQAALYVDAENWSGALALYESMGYEVIRRSVAYRKPLG